MKYWKIFCDLQSSSFKLLEYYDIPLYQVGFYSLIRKQLMISFHKGQWEKFYNLYCIFHPFKYCTHNFFYGVHNMLNVYTVFYECKSFFLISKISSINVIFVMQKEFCKEFPSYTSHFKIGISGHCNFVEFYSR